MTKEDRMQFERFARSAGFYGRRKADFAPASRGARLFGELEAVVSALENDASEQQEAGGAAIGATTSKSVVFADMKRQTMKIRATAVSLEAEVPGIENQFELPRTSAELAWRNTADAFAKAAAPHEALLIEMELPADFIARLRASVAAYDGAKDDQRGDKGEAVGTTQAVADGIQAGVRLMGLLDPLVKNKYDGNRVVLGEWAHDSATEKVPVDPSNRPKPAPARA